MTEPRAPYFYLIREAGNQPEEPIPHASPPLSPHTILDLGQHTLELLEEQVILLIDNKTAGEKEAVQLDRDETYRLLITLQSWFRAMNDEGQSEL